MTYEAMTALGLLSVPAAAAGDFELRGHGGSTPSPHSRRRSRRAGDGVRAREARLRLPDTRSAHASGRPVPHHPPRHAERGRGLDRGRRLRRGALLQRRADADSASSSNHARLLPRAARSGRGVRQRQRGGLLVSGEDRGARRTTSAQPRGPRRLSGLHRGAADQGRVQPRARRAADRRRSGRAPRVPAAGRRTRREGRIRRHAAARIRHPARRRRNLRRRRRRPFRSTICSVRKQDSISRRSTCTQATMFQVAGGTDRIAAAFAARLNGRIVYGAEVREIHQDGDGVSVVYMKGSRAHRATAAYAVCAMPLVVLASLQGADFAPDVRTAMASVPYSAGRQDRPAVQAAVLGRGRRDFRRHQQDRPGDRADRVSVERVPRSERHAPRLLPERRQRDGDRPADAARPSGRGPDAGGAHPPAIPDGVRDGVLGVVAERAVEPGRLGAGPRRRRGARPIRCSCGPTGRCISPEITSAT